MRIIIDDPSINIARRTMDQLSRDLNRNENFNYLDYHFGMSNIALIRPTANQSQQIFLGPLGLHFDYTVSEDFPLRFRAFIDAILVRAAEERSRQYPQPKTIKPVSANHGRQFFITPKILEAMKDPSNCSICLEQLLPENMKRKKIWTLGCGCNYHKICVAKWFKEESRCPNCRSDCAD